MSITVREFEAQDYASVLAIYHRAEPPGVYPPEVDAPNSRLFVAQDLKRGEVVGYAEVSLTELHAFNLVVSPLWQRKGIGRLLWQRISQDLAIIGAVSVEPWVREENAAGIGWLLKHGFAPTRLDGPVSLFLSSLDMSPFATAESNVINQGIVISTLANEREHDPECFAKLCGLYNRANADAAAPAQYREQSVDEFIRAEDVPESMPDAYFVAKRGHAYIGMSYLRPRGPDPNCVEPGNVQQCFTGVLPEYRRLGIATALKIKTIGYARDHGFLRLLTNSDNPAMRALNAKLGFQSGPWRVYIKTVPKCD